MLYLYSISYFENIHGFIYSLAFSTPIFIGFKEAKLQLQRHKQKTTNHEKVFFNDGNFHPRSTGHERKSPGHRQVRIPAGTVSPAG